MVPVLGHHLAVLEVGGRVDGGLQHQLQPTHHHILQLQGGREVVAGVPLAGHGGVVVGQLIASF